MGERPENKVRALLLLVYPGAKCGYSGDQPGSQVYLFGPMVSSLPPVNRGDIRGLACTHKIVFYTQVTPLSVEMGVLRLSHWCLWSGRKRKWPYVGNHW